MTEYSQNGWTADDRTVIASYALPGGRVALRQGDPSVVLLWCANRWHETVEPLKWPGIWGYAERAVRGSATTLSNHASGTAIDCNAPEHPLGTDPGGNFTKAQIGAIHAIVNACEGVVRWGGDYTGRKDGMHLEINAGSAAVRRIADKIRNPPAVTTPTAPRKDTEMLENIEVRGQGSLRRIIPIGSASLVLARAWVSLATGGPSVASAHVYFQSDTGGLADVELTANFRDGWSSRPWHEAPDGTTQVVVQYDAPDGAVIALEGAPK